ncbi:MAG: hypothetical protein KAX46_13010 [Chromatiaceae bacterium]|jgi:hypothetical protein|nr:hypothetical protein [Chromatiaceae bacterium]
MTPRDLRPEMWRIIRRVGAQGRPFDVLQVRGQLRGAIRRERVRDYLKALEAGGYLVPCTLDDGAPGWQLLRDPGNETPRVRADGTPIVQGAGREQCWRAMRQLVSFDLVMLVAVASTDRWAVAPGEARDYCDRLARAGILTRTRGGDWPSYVLPPARWTGPRPPQIRKSKAVYDPNTGRVYPPKSRQETQP